MIVGVGASYITRSYDMTSSLVDLSIKRRDQGVTPQIPQINEGILHDIRW